MTGFNSKRDAAADKLQPALVWPENKTFSHWSDCAVHNGPAYPAGPCDCGAWHRNNWRCGHGWLRGEQCEICNAPQRKRVGLTPEETSGFTQHEMTVVKYVSKVLQEKNS
jgi:hypothetical protein